MAERLDGSRCRLAKILEDRKFSLEISGPKWSYIVNFRCTGRPGPRGFSLTSLMDDPALTLVYCGQTVGWIKMKLGMQVALVTGHIVLDGDPSHLPKGAQPAQFSAHVCCGQMAGWIKMPLGWKVSFVG